MKVTLYEFCLLHHQEELLEQWDPANLPATPQNVTYGTRDEYWWQCEGAPLAGSGEVPDLRAGLPHCTTRRLQPGVNDFATRFPDIAAQWHPTKNNGLRPEQVAANSNRSVWWQCEQGHTWRAPVGRRVQFATGCPYCTGRKVLPGFNDLASLEPQVAAQWDTERTAPSAPTR